MFLSRNKKNNLHPCKHQLYYVKVGFQGFKIMYRHAYVMQAQKTKQKKKKKKKKKKLSVKLFGTDVQFSANESSSVTLVQVVAVKRLPVLQSRANCIFISFGIVEPILIAFENWIPLESMLHMNGRREGIRAGSRRRAVRSLPFLHIKQI